MKPVALAIVDGCAVGVALSTPSVDLARELESLHAASFACLKWSPDKAKFLTP
jgi:hypothetical protein